MEAFYKIIVILVLTVLSVLAGAWALSTLWAWFIVPIGFPAIGWAHAYGIMMLLNLFKLKASDFDTKIDTGFEESIKRLLFFILTYTIAVGFGWITLLFV